MGSQQGDGRHPTRTEAGELIYMPGPGAAADEDDEDDGSYTPVCADLGYALGASTVVAVMRLRQAGLLAEIEPDDGAPSDLVRFREPDGTGLGWSRIRVQPGLVDGLLLAPERS